MFVASASPPDSADFIHLPAAPTSHPMTELISAMVSCYGAVEQIARARGFDPDSPPLLKKVTETV
jgi:glutamine---fructose-6-phosphate transaminase (isomerizing)